jgi:hypothetical protein
MFSLQGINGIQASADLKHSLRIVLDPGKHACTLLCDVPELRPNLFHPIPDFRKIRVPGGNGRGKPGCFLELNQDRQLPFIQDVQDLG